MKKKRYGLIALLLAGVAGFAFGLLAQNGLERYPPPVSAAFGDQSSRVSLEWQEVGTNITRTVHRAPVPGGWLVAQQSGLAFIPDPDHAWKGGK